MQNGDEALPSIFLTSQGFLVKMGITLEPYHIYFDQILHNNTSFKIGQENDKEKENIYRKILVTSGLELLCQIVGLQERLLDHLATMHCILH